MFATLKQYKDSSESIKFLHVVVVRKNTDPIFWSPEHLPTVVVLDGWQSSDAQMQVIDEKMSPEMDSTGISFALRLL